MRTKYIVIGLFSGLFSSGAFAQSLPSADSFGEHTASRTKLRTASSVITPRVLLDIARGRRIEHRERIIRIRESLREFRRGKPASP